MRCLVTGASGHLGSYLTRLLIERGEEVAILVRPTSDLWRLEGVESQINIIRAELENIASAEDALTNFSPEVVFHLAWHGVTSEHRNDDEQILSNTIGSLHLFQIVKKINCRCWVGLGSQAEYGPYSSLLTEDLPTRPITSYGVSKLSVGLLTQKLCELSKIRHLWIRLLATYGPKDDERHLIPSIIKKFLAREKPSLTLGEQKWDYLFVEDAAEAIYILAVQNTLNGIFNLGYGSSVPIKEIVKYTRDLIDLNLPIGFGEIPYRDDQSMFLGTSIDKITQASHWKPKTPIKTGLKLTVDWYKQKYPSF